MLAGRGRFTDRRLGSVTGPSRTAGYEKSTLGASQQAVVNFMSVAVTVSKAPRSCDNFGPRAAIAGSSRKLSLNFPVVRFIEVVAYSSYSK